MNKSKLIYQQLEQHQLFVISFSILLIGRRTPSLLTLMSLTLLMLSHILPSEELLSCPFCFKLLLSDLTPLPRTFLYSIFHNFSKLGLILELSIKHFPSNCLSHTSNEAGIFKSFAISISRSSLSGM